MISACRDASESHTPPCAYVPRRHAGRASGGEMNREKSKGTFQKEIVTAGWAFTKVIDQRVPLYKPDFN